MQKDYEEIVADARRNYFSIGFLVCPVLGNKVIYFTENGFRHFIFKGRLMRRRSEQMRRFSLMKYIRKIIVSDDSCVVGRRLIRKVTYIAIENSFVRIIVREDRGRIIFVSILNTNKNSG